MFQDKPGLRPLVDNCNTVVSLPAVKDDPAANTRSATTTSPTPLDYGHNRRHVSGVNDTTCGDGRETSC